MLLVATATIVALCGKGGSDRPPSFLFILGDDIGWADFRYNNGTAASPNIKTWTESPGTLMMQDFHSGGTVCSPTRATVLTGRNHFRDCVDFVYGCSDMTECVPDFEFSPSTFTVPMAVRAANKSYTSWFGGKWHLGSFYNDSESLGGRLSSPISHGFDFMNATVEVAPTATSNCECKKEWYEQCDFGHDGAPSHCNGKGNPGGGSPLEPGCCFNYWWNDDTATHGVANLTNPSPDNDANDYLARALVDWIEGRNGAPFMAQISMHNCHVPFIGTPTEREKCNSTESCLGPSGDDVTTGRAGGAYTSAELDFYACLNEFDEAVGSIISALKQLNYYDNTMIWFTTDNGPEVNCAPEGRCGSASTGQIPPGTLYRPDSRGPGSAGPLRGRKRDVWEGGHRVPGIVSWPAVAKGPAREVWHPVVTMDFMATVLDVLNLSRPPTQQNWNFDGVSILPILRGEDPEPRGIGWMYSLPIKSEQRGYAFRYDKWKYVAGGISCVANNATFNCSKEQLYDMTTDYVEDHDLADQFPEVLAAISANFTAWYRSVWDSRVNESKCQTGPVSPFGPDVPPQVPFPPTPVASNACTFVPGKHLAGPYVAHGVVKTQQECCGACRQVKECVASAFTPASAMRPSWDGSIDGGECVLSDMDNLRPPSGNPQMICKPK